MLFFAVRTFSADADIVYLWIIKGLLFLSILGGMYSSEEGVRFICGIKCFKFLGGLMPLRPGSGVGGAVCGK